MVKPMISFAKHWLMYSILIAFFSGILMHLAGIRLFPISERLLFWVLFWTDLALLLILSITILVLSLMKLLGRSEIPLCCKHLSGILLTIACFINIPMLIPVIDNGAWVINAFLLSLNVLYILQLGILLYVVILVVRQKSEMVKV